MKNHIVTIARDMSHYAEILFWFAFGVAVGLSGYKGYLMYQSFMYDEPVEYLCKNNVVYEQADPVSTIYIKTDKECITSQERDNA